MELRQLRYFVAVAEELSFTKAAERLNVSQPPLSMQIKALEDELGAILLRRTRRKVELTPAGMLLLESARKALGELRRATEIVALSAKGEAGLIRLGFTGSVPMLDMFPRLMRIFRDRYPEIGIELRHMSTGRQLQAILAGELDVGILRPPYYFQASPGLITHRMWRDKLCVFMPANHALTASIAPIDLLQLKEEAFVSVTPDIGCGMYDHFMTLCNIAGFAPKIVQHAHELSSVLGLVAAGIGLAILPECYARVGIFDVISRALAQPGAVSELLLATRANPLSPQSQHFVGIALAARV